MQCLEYLLSGLGARVGGCDVCGGADMLSDGPTVHTRRNSRRCRGQTNSNAWAVLETNGPKDSFCPVEPSSYFESNTILYNV